MCATHPHLPRRIFCCTCNELICGYCVAFNRCWSRRLRVLVIVPVVVDEEIEVVEFEHVHSW